MIGILIVDDRKEFRTLFKSLLKVSDLDVDLSEAEDGASALIILGQKKFDCVILDYILADSIGLEVFQQIKSIQPSIPVLIISSYDQSYIEKDILKMSPSAFLSKEELSMEKLTQTITQIMPKRDSDPKVSNSAFEELKGMKVLIADDNPQNLDVLRKTLDHKGLNISFALNGQTALKLVSKDPPDLIMLDVMMPVMDGFETCQKLKENDSWKNIPIIFITALTKEEDVIKGFSMGAVDYISKPFCAEEVLARVNTHLRISKLIKTKDLLINQVTNKEIHLSVLMDNMLDGLVVVDHNLVIRSFNPAIEKIFGYSEVIGKILETLIPSTNNEELYNYFEHYSDSESSHPRGKTLELVGVGKNRRNIPLELAISKVNFSPQEGSQTIKFEQLFVGLVRDISQRIESEKQLVEARETAEEANRAKSDFLAKMSHELRTPLNSIMGFSQLLTMDPDLSKHKLQIENIGRIYKSGSFLLDLINEVLDLARIEAGRVKVSMEPVELSLLMEELVIFTQPIADEHQIRLIYKSGENKGLHCEVDRSRLKQVLLNLISNAIKYNIEGGTVTLSIKKDVQKVRIMISDTGPGISEDQQESIFQPFNRLEADQTDIIGSGIGLTIAKELIELMNGTIGVESIMGKGCTFYVELDTLETPVKQKASILKQIAPETSTQKIGKKYTVLYVEDNPDNLELVQQTLNINRNINLINAPQAEMGIDLAKTHDVDLILMDINLPGMNGVEAMKILRRTEKTSSLPILAVSANAMERDIKSCLSAGFTDYIVKPINIPQFLEKIDKILT